MEEPLTTGKLENSVTPNWPVKGRFEVPIQGPKELTPYEKARRKGEWEYYLSLMEFIL